MPTPYERLLVSRFLIPGAGGRLALLIAAIGCAGVAIGVAALVLVVSFMNGAEARLASQIASADGHVFVTGPGHRIARPHALERALAAIPGVGTATASLDASGLVTVDGRSLAVDLQGVDPARLAAGPLFRRGAAGLVGTAPVGAGSVALGRDLADRLGIDVHDRLAITLVRMGPDGLEVDNYPFEVSATLATGVYAFDSRRVLLPAATLGALLRTTATASRISVRLADPDRQPEVVAAIAARLGPGYAIATWQEMNIALFSALAQERVVMTVILSFVTMIALSNVLCSMVMLVRYKAREIAILRTMGLSRLSVARVFVGVGATIGLAGELAGLAIGFALKAAKDPVTLALLRASGHPPVGLRIFLSLPLIVSWGEVAWIVGLVSAGVLLSTLYPALRAAAVDPAAVLRHS